jgi:hypothetical protein
VNESSNIWLNSTTIHVSPTGDTSLDMTRYSLTIEKALPFFAEAGVPRATRTITRFCALGELDCIRVETERNFKYLIDSKSVQKRIEQLKQALHFTSKTSPDMSRHDEQARETPARTEELELLRERVEELEIETLHLKISKQANEIVINQMNNERKELATQLNMMNFQLGEAQAKLQMLEAPRPAEPAQHTEPQSTEKVSDAVEVPSEPAPAAPPLVPPTPQPAADLTPEKPNFFKRMFGR